MRSYNLDIKEDDLKDIKFCTGSTGMMIEGIMFHDAAGAIAKINGFDTDPASRPQLNLALYNFMKTLTKIHQIKFNEDMGVSFDKWIKAGKSAIGWFKEKKYIR